MYTYMVFISLLIYIYTYIEEYSEANYHSHSHPLKFPVPSFLSICVPQSHFHLALDA